jgi:hypothetical protein
MQPAVEGKSLPHEDVPVAFQIGRAVGLGQGLEAGGVARVAGQQDGVVGEFARDVAAQHPPLGRRGAAALARRGEIHKPGLGKPMAHPARVGGAEDARNLVAKRWRHRKGAAQPAAQIVVLEFGETGQFVDAKQMQLRALVAEHVGLAWAAAKGELGAVYEFKALPGGLKGAKAPGKLGQGRQNVVAFQLRHGAPEKVGPKARHAQAGHERLETQGMAFARPGRAAKQDFIGRAGMEPGLDRLGPVVDGRGPGRQCRNTVICPQSRPPVAPRKT